MILLVRGATVPTSDVIIMWSTFHVALKGLMTYSVD